MEYHPIDIRSPRRGGSYYGYDDDDDDYYYWPIYLYVIVSMLILMASLFFWSLIFYSVRGETTGNCCPMGRQLVVLDISLTPRK